ncbi:hypothetical protein AB3327_13580 [Lactiplantibacillus pentosus]|uniref:hypothetical protein n=1 Tax=Lactiplantibacillus pentosus TaxID=1589 RepID=UPI0034D3D19A
MSKMGFFDGLKKLANEVTDTERVQLGTEIENIKFRDEIRRRLVGSEDDKHLSITSIEHKKVDNLRNSMSLDYQQAVFFMDTTMLRNNGNLGFGMTTTEFYWSFESGNSGKLAMDKILFATINNNQVSWLISNSETNEPLIEEVDFAEETIPIIRMIKSLLEADPDKIQSFKKTIDVLLADEKVNNDVLEHIDNLTLTDNHEHSLAEVRMLASEIRNNNWRAVNIDLNRLRKYDETAFEKQRILILAIMADICHDSKQLLTFDQKALFQIFKAFDFEHQYVSEMVRLLINLNEFFDARIICLTKLDEETRKSYLAEMDAVDSDISEQAGQAVRMEDIAYFKNNPNAADVLLDGGVMPVELALILQKSNKFIKQLKKLSDDDYLKYSANSFQFTWNMMAANQHDLKYFIKLTDHDSRPTDYVMDTGRGMIISAKRDSIRAQEKAYRDGKPVDLERLNRERESLNTSIQNQNDANRKLEREQAEWDSMMKQSLATNYAAFYKKLNFLNEEMVKDNLRVRYVEGESKLTSQFQDRIQENKKKIIELTGQINNMTTYLVEEDYKKAPLTRTEFEEAEAYKKRVRNYKKELLSKANKNAPLAIEKAQNEIEMLDAEIADNQQSLTELPDKIKAEKWLLDQAFQNWASKEPASHLLTELARLCAKHISIGDYDADGQKFSYQYSGGEGHLKVPIQIAQSFREEFTPENVTGMEVANQLIKVRYEFSNQAFVIPAVKVD